MATEVADLYSILRIETSPFTTGLRTASEEGESFTAKMGGLGATMSKLGAATVMAGVAVAGVSIKMAGDFQASMLKLTTTAGESEANLTMVSDGVKKLAVDTGTSTKELADGMYLVESAGFHGAAGLTVLKSAAEGARAEQAPLAEVSNAVTSALKSYHLGADQATTITNQMVAAVGAGKMTFGEFSGSLATVLPIASSANLSFAEIGGAIATLTNHGTSAREATQELANTIRGLQAPNNVAVAEMQRLGLSSVDVSTHLGQRGLTGTIDMLQQAVLSHMGPAGTVLLNTFNTSKQAAQNADQMIASMPASLQALAKSYQSGKISVEDWRASLKGLPVDQANLATQFATLINKSQGFNQQLKSGGPAEQTFNDAMKKMLGGATGLNTALMLGGENMADFQRNVKTVAAAGQGAGKDINGWSDITKTFNFQMSQLKERLETAAITIGTKLIPPVLAVINFFMKYRSATIALAVVIGGVLVTAVAVFTANLWAMAAAAWATGIPELIIAVVALVAAIVLLVMHWRTVWDWIKNATKATVEAIGSAWHWLGSETAKVWRDITGWVTGAWHSVASFFASAWHSVADPILNAWHSIENTTSSVWNGITGFFRKWWPLLLVIFDFPLALLISIWNHFHEQIVSVATTVWNAISGFFRSVWNGILDAGRFVWQLIQSAVIDPVMSIWHETVRIWNSVSAWVDQKWRELATIARVTWAVIKQEIITPVLDLWNQVTSVFDRISTAIGNAFDRALNYLSGMLDRFGSFGHDLVMGIVNGISGAAHFVTDKLKNLANDALQSAKSFLGISSPSRVMADEVGKWIPAGIAQGIDDHGRVAQNAVEDLAGSLTGQIGTGRLPGLALAGAGTSVGGAPVVFNITVQGSVLSENDLRDLVEQQMYRVGMRNSSTWQPYARR